MKIYIVCDLEGTADVADQIHQCSFNHDRYDKGYIPGQYGLFYLQARRLATLELNGVVEGILETGVTDIWAWDGIDFISTALFPEHSRNRTYWSGHQTNSLRLPILSHFLSDLGNLSVFLFMNIVTM